MTHDSKPKPISGTAQAFDRMAEWRGSLDALGKSVSRRRESPPQPPTPEPREVTDYETDIPRSVHLRAPTPVEPLPPEEANLLLRKISRLEHEAFILRRIFGEQNLSPVERKILIDVDADLAELRLKFRSGAPLNA